MTCKKGIINTNFTTRNKQQTFSLKTGRVGTCLSDTSLQKFTRHIPVFNWPLTTGLTKLRVTQQNRESEKAYFYSTTSWPQHVSTSSYPKKKQKTSGCLVSVTGTSWHSNQLVEVKTIKSKLLGAQKSWWLIQVNAGLYNADLTVFKKVRANHSSEIVPLKVSP